MPQVRSTTPDGVGAIFRAAWRRDFVQQISAVEGFDRGRRKVAHTEWKPLQGRARILRLLQYQHGKASEPQFTGEKQAYGTGAGNHNIEQCGAVRELLLMSISDQSGSSGLRTTRPNE